MGVGSAEDAKGRGPSIRLAETGAAMSGTRSGQAGTRTLWVIAGILALVTAGLLAAGLINATLQGAALLSPTSVAVAAQAVVCVFAGVLALAGWCAAVPWLLLVGLLLDIASRVVNGYVIWPWDTAINFGDIADYAGVFTALTWLGIDVAFVTAVAAMVVAIVAFARRGRPVTPAHAGAQMGVGAYTHGGGAMTSSTSTIPPGWYADPDGKPAQRFWDGTAWTEQSRPMLPSLVSAPVTNGAQARPGAPLNGMGTAALTLGIIGLLLGGVLSLLAVIFGAVGVSRANRGQATNKGAALWGLCLGIVGVVGWIVLFLALVVSSSPGYY